MKLIVVEIIRDKMHTVRYEVVHDVKQKYETSYGKHPTYLRGIDAPVSAMRWLIKTIIKEGYERNNT